jgi:hypothetical protein
MPSRGIRVPLLALLALLAAAPLAQGKRIEDLDRARQKEVIDAARAYFADPDFDAPWAARKQFRAVLGQIESEGTPPLKDLQLLQDVVNQGRAFAPEFSDRDWQKLNDIADHRKARVAANTFNVVSERLRFTYSLPKDYKGGKALTKLPREEPRPLLVTLHEDADYTGKEYPGEEVLERRWPKKTFGDLYDNWFILAPVAARAMFTETDRSIRHPFYTEVLRQMWRRYHIDFERVILDGTSDAAIIAASQPYVYAGLVLRGGEVEPDLVKNYASVPVYVVGDDKLAKALTDAGHPSVTQGDDAGLYAWMEKQRAVTPKSFHWTVTRTDHELAQWIQLFTLDWSAPRRVLDVQVVDTPEEPNTIRIDAEGVFEMVLLLNDRVVDLDRDVRLVVNGHETKAGKLERDFGTCFDKGFQIRRSMNYGYLFPARFPTDPRDLYKVLPPEKPKEATPPEGTQPPEEGAGAVQGTEADERTAARTWAKAQEAEAEGDLERAKQLYESIVNMPPTSFKAKAEEKVKTLGEKSPAGAGKD